MELRTTFEIEPAGFRLDYSTPVMFIGSCFASEIGNRMKEGKMDVLINPSGTVYNPVSIAKTLDFVMENRVFSKENLSFSNGKYFSFLHYTDFNSEDPLTVLERINRSVAEAHTFLKNASCLFITFGTSRIYRFTESREIVSNCHKLPEKLFTKEILTPEAITVLWQGLLDRLAAFNPGLKVIFTISPVRHWKDGAHGNQVSKSILFMATESLRSHSSKPGYFPAFELLMDDLRDYRYYADDMLHPSSIAIDYIWKAFSDYCMEPSSIQLWKEIRNIRKALNHRVDGRSHSDTRDFANSMIKKIDTFIKRNPGIDLSEERAFFNRFAK